MVSNKQKVQRKYNQAKKIAKKEFNELKDYIKQIMKYKGIYLYETIAFFIFICIMLIIITIFLYIIMGIIGLIIGVLWSWYIVVLTGLLMARIK